MRVKKWLKRFLFAGSAATVIVAILTSMLYFAFVRTIRAEDYPAFEEWPLYEWATVDVAGESACSDDSDFRIYARRGDSQNLLIHFSGGGACWDSETCSQPIELSNMTGYYFAYIWEIRRAFLGGIFQHDNPNNPLRDWNIAYIPYCTADFHLGTATRTYALEDGESITVHHSGRKNVTAALEWIYETFDQPEKLLISGDSAGAWGSMLWTPTIAEHYSSSAIYQLADGAYIATPRWSEFLETWEAEPFPFEAGDDLLNSAYAYYAEQPNNNITYLHINTLFDSVIISFAAKMNGSDDFLRYRELWSEGMPRAVKTTAESGLNYHYFLTDFGLDPENGGTPHTSVSDKLFFEMEEDGMFLYDWLRSAVIDDEPFSVGTGFLPAD